MATSIDAVVRRRLATHRLTSTPHDDPADAVRSLVCVQAQGAPLARFAVGLRSGADDAEVRAAIDDGRIVRTHILRPTWHFVAPEDLRWILELTSAKVLSSMRARHRQLGIDEATLDRSFQAISALLAGTHATRAQVSVGMGERGLPDRGEQLGHLLLVAELRGLICSGPLVGPHHTYALTDERIPPTPRRDRADAVRELVHRFFAGHGPAAVADLTRWTALTQAEVTGALAELGGTLTSVALDGTTLWFDPSTSFRSRGRPRAFLLHTFDEAFLTYARHGIPRAPGHPRGTLPHRFAEAGGGVVVCDRLEVGWWKRTERAGAVVVHGELSTGLTADQRAEVAAAAERLARFTRKDLRLDLT